MYLITQLVLIASFSSLALSSIGLLFSSNQCPAVNGFKKLKKLNTNPSQPVAVLGAPFWKGQLQMGTELAPDLFREQNIINQIKRLGIQTVVDYGNLKFIDNPKDNERTLKTRNNFTEIHNQYTLRDANKLIESSVESILRKKETLVILGGDHSVTAGAILGNAKVNPNVCVIYVDAHGDLNNCESTTSGNLHGMPLSFVIKGMEKLHKNYSSCPAMRALVPAIDASNVATIANRDLDNLELDIINDFKIKHFSVKDIDEIGIIGAISQVLNTVCKSRPIHVSFDIDSVDVTYTPNTGTSVIGGLTMREALQLAEMIAETNRLTVIEMYEVNPKMGPESRSIYTVNYAMNIILAFLGKSREVYWAMPWEGGWAHRKK